MLNRFVELKNTGQLVTPDDCARRIVDFLENADLDHGGVYDLRRL